jgi:hypothetical protein
LDGAIRANGGTGDGCGKGAGGSGGGIRIDAGTLSGSGTIQANGGDALRDSYYGLSAGGGGGGRIAIYYTDISGFNIANISAMGGVGATNRIGAPGTIFLKSSADVYGTLIVDAQNRVGVFTPLEDNSHFDDVRILNGTLLYINNNLTIENLLRIDNGSTLQINGTIMARQLQIANNSLLSQPGATLTTEPSLRVVADTITIDSSSAIDVSGRGYLGAWQGGNNSSNGRTLANAVGSGIRS